MTLRRKKNPKKKESKKNEHVAKYREKWDPQIKKQIYVNVAGQKEAPQVLLIAIVFLIIGTVGFLLGISILYNSNFIYWFTFAKGISYGIAFNTPLEILSPRAVIVSLIQSEAEISVAWVYLILPLVHLPIGIGYLLVKKWGWYIGLIGGVISMIIGIFLFIHQPPELFYSLHYLVSGFLIINGFLIFFYLALAKDRKEGHQAGWFPALILIIVIFSLFLYIFILILAATIFGVNFMTSVISSHYFNVCNLI